ncbi:hypothetical protein KUCAC02_036122 [Chaenocephalus aceratus]|nr:hypothetical protein KUCAC02_036122 [Chaenocephalus aceratus]
MSRRRESRPTLHRLLGPTKTRRENSEEGGVGRGQPSERRGDYHRIGMHFWFRAANADVTELVGEETAQPGVPEVLHCRSRSLPVHTCVEES